MPQFENTPSDKVQFRALGEAPSPGTCIVCGSGTNEDGYVDLGVWLEYIGEGLICATCLVQCAELIGMLTKDEVNTMRDQADNLLVENINLKVELRKANERLAAFDVLLDSARSSLADPTRSGGQITSDPGPVSFNAANVGESESSESVTSDESERSGEIIPDDSSSGETPALIQL